MRNFNQISSPGVDSTRATVVTATDTATTSSLFLVPDRLTSLPYYNRLRACMHVSLSLSLCLSRHHSLRYVSVVVFIADTAMPCTRDIITAPIYLYSSVLVSRHRTV